MSFEREQSPVVQKCFYNARSILSRLEKGAFLLRGTYVDVFPFAACLLVEREDAFTVAVCGKVEAVVRKIFEGAQKARRRSVSLINACVLEDAFLAIPRCGAGDGQWVISTNQHLLRDGDVGMTHVHVARSNVLSSPLLMTRVLVVHEDAYVDVCAVFVPISE